MIETWLPVASLCLSRHNFPPHYSSHSTLPNALSVSKTIDPQFYRRQKQGNDLSLHFGMLNLGGCLQKVSIITLTLIPSSGVGGAHLFRSAIINFLGSIHMANTDVVSELARRQLGLKHLVNLLEGAALGLGQEEQNPEHTDDAAGEPDEAILGTPRERGRIDEIWRCKSCEPGAEETNGGGETESVASETLRGDLSACEPGVGGDHAVVGHHVDAGQGYQDDSGGIGCAQDMVDNSDDQLEDTADGQTGGEDDAASAPADNDQAVEEDGENAHGGEDVAHSERVRDLGHGEEVGLVGDDEHGTGGGLQEDSTNGETGASSVDGVLEHVHDADAAAELLLPVDGGFDFGTLGIDIGANGTQPPESLDTLLVVALEDEPAGGLGNEEEGDGHDDRDDVDHAKGNQVGGLVGALSGGPVDDGADQSTLFSFLSAFISIAMCEETRVLTKEVKNWKAVKNQPLYLAGLDSWIYSWLKVMKYPLANPMRKRPA